MTRPRHSSRVWRLVLLLLVPVGLWALLLGRADHLTHSRADDLASTPPATIPRIIGLDRLERQLGAAVPTGRGVRVGHVESGEAGDYLPHVQASRFEGVRFIDRGEAGAYSGHASATATILYGPRGLTPGVREVHCYPSDHWLEDGCLNTRSSQWPDAGGVDLFTHSWIRSTPHSSDREILQRVDDLIDRQGVLVVTGVDNGRDTPVPSVIASAYNAIAVGQWEGVSSGGYTRVAGTGRCKPEVVAPGPQTSYSTPVVAAVLARLLEAARALPQAELATRPETLKAVLLAGAAKPANWSPEPGRPLDAHTGAGQVRLDRSHAILMRGPQRPGALTAVDGTAGWDCRSIASGDTQAWSFQVDEPAGPLSVALTWHRRIGPPSESSDETAPTGPWQAQPRLANLDLTLAQVTREGERVVARSTSRRDNVEHIYLPRLQPGRYRLSVTRHDRHDELWRYALAWQCGAMGGAR